MRNLPYHLSIFPLFCSLRVPDGVPHHLRLRDDAVWRRHLYHHRCRRGRFRLGRFSRELPGYSSTGKAPVTPINGLFIIAISQIHLWCDTCWTLGDQHGSRAVLFHVPVSRHWWGSKPGSIVLLLPHGVRSGRCSTDWAMPAWLFL